LPYATLLTWNGFGQGNSNARDKSVAGGYCPEDLRELVSIMQRADLPLGIAAGIGRHLLGVIGQNRKTDIPFKHLSEDTGDGQEQDLVANVVAAVPGSPEHDVF
jgi:hypothetical protein